MCPRCVYRVFGHCRTPKLCAVLSPRKALHYLVAIARTEEAKNMFLLYFVTFVVVLPLLCHDLRHSVYLSIHNKTNMQNVLKHENEMRTEDAKRYLDLLDRTKLHRMLERAGGGAGSAGNASVDVAIAVITVSRNRHYMANYLTQVIWKLLTLLHESQLHRTYYNYTTKISVCNVDPDPDSYQEAKDLSKLVPVFNRFLKVSLPIEHILEREKEDYVFCMNKTMKYNPRYSLIIEDDALPKDNFFQVLGYMIKTHLDNDHLYRGDRDSPPAQTPMFVKLYHPERLQMYWSLEPDRIPELIGVIVFFSCIATCVYTWWFTRTSSVWIAICFGVYFTLISVLAGRPNVMSLREYFSPYLHTYVPAAECCTPAMLFPTEGAKQVISYLSHVKCKARYGKDMALEKFKQTSGIPTKMIQPNIVQHIGLYSILRHGFIDPFVV